MYCCLLVDYYYYYLIITGSVFFFAFISQPANSMLILQRNISIGGTRQSAVTYIHVFKWYICKNKMRLIYPEPPPSYWYWMLIRLCILKVKDFARKLVKGPTNEITLKSDEELILDVITQLWIGKKGGGGDYSSLKVWFREYGLWFFCWLNWFPYLFLVLACRSKR